MRMRHQPPRRVCPAPRRLASVLVALAGAPLAFVTGCGLINSDLASVSFDLPPKSYTFDTGQTDWNGSASGAFAVVPAIACGTDGDCCPDQIRAAGIACANMVCDGATATCAFAVNVESPHQTINLKSEANLPSSLANQSVLDITVSKLSYDVGQNSLNVDLPPVDLYLAQSDTDPSPTRFATVPAIVHGTTVTNGNIPIEPAANTAFDNIGMHLGTPFVFLARTRVLVPGGTPAPTGAVTLTIKGQLSAKPNL